VVSVANQTVRTADYVDTRRVVVLMNSIGSYVQLFCTKNMYLYATKWK